MGSVARNTSRVWTNWAGNQICQPEEIARPTTEEEIVACVERASSSKSRIKAVGSGHSFTDIACGSGVMVSLEYHTGIEDHSLDPPQATIRAGTTIEAAGEALDAAGLAFSSLGDIGKQSLAGATATGTHGTSSLFGSISAQIRYIRMVDGKARLLELSEHQEPEIFRAAQVNLGALGIVTSIGFDLEPAFNLKTKEWPMGWDEALERIDELRSDNEHFEFFWFPHTETVLAKSHNRTTKVPKEIDPRKVWFYTVFMGNYVFDALCRIGRAFPAAVPAINRRIVNMENPSSRVLPGYRAFINERRVRFYEMEYAVPVEEAVNLLRRLKKAIDASGLKISFPVEVRFTPPELPWLSPGYRRDTAWIAVHTYKGVQPFQYFQMVEAFMREVGGRPHWGKMHFQTAETLKKVYPKWKAFQEVRRELDPDGLFSNPYLDRVLGG
jgi:FAD-linked oxidoreductase